MAQRYAELGLFAGASNYVGDMNFNSLIYKPKPAIGLVYKYNFNPHYSVKVNAIRGAIEANDMDFLSKYLYQKFRAFAFENNWFLDFSGQVEFNFFPVSLSKQLNGFSPFVSTGLAVAYFSKTSPNIQFSLPYGTGIKYKFSPKFEISANLEIRRTYTDKLEGISPTFAFGQYVNKQQTFTKTKDWYTLLGIRFLYNISDRKNTCEAYKLRH